MKKRNVIIIHVVFWILFSIIPQFSFRLGHLKHNEEVLGFFFLLIMSNVLNFYLYYFFILPEFYTRKRMTRFAVYTSVFVIVFTVFRTELSGLFRLWIDFSPPHAEYWRFVLRDTINTITYCSYAFFIRLIIDYANIQRLKASLIKERQESELRQLRFQINPHFLFNTLNNIYSLVNKKSDKASDAVMRLSGIMRYMLQEAVLKEVPLEKEIAYLRSFIELQSLRLKDDKFVEFSISGDVEGRKIPPMILIPFVENAFKHGLKKGVSPGIFISLEAEEERLSFKVINYLAGKEVHKDMGSGIGLQNVRRRLDLLYPERYSLSIDENEKHFIVHLRILG